MRNRLLVLYHEQYPDVPLEDIGKAFDGISKARVGQIIKRDQELRKERAAS